MVEVFRVLGLDGHLEGEAVEAGAGMLGRELPVAADAAIILDPEVAGDGAVGTLGVSGELGAGVGDLGELGLGITPGLDAAVDDGDEAHGPGEDVGVARCDLLGEGQ